MNWFRQHRCVDSYLPRRINQSETAELWKKGLLIIDWLIIRLVASFLRRSSPEEPHPRAASRGTCRTRSCTAWTRPASCPRWSGRTPPTSSPPWRAICRLSSRPRTSRLISSPPSRPAPEAWPPPARPLNQSAPGCQGTSLIPAWAASPAVLALPQQSRVSPANFRLTVRGRGRVTWRDRPARKRGEGGNCREICPTRLWCTLDNSKHSRSRPPFRRL